MNKTKKNENIKTEKILVDMEELKDMLTCGRETAIKIGEKSQSKVMIGRRVLWNVQKIKEYLYNIAA